MRLNNPLSSPIRGPVHGLFTDMLRYPDGAILYYDANTDAYTEQTYGPHTFNSSILSPQYQRNANGSYTDVGANPAVDVFDGEKWLRSCGAVTNLVPSQFADVRNWTIRGAATVVKNEDGSFRCTIRNSGDDIHFTPPSNTTVCTMSIFVKYVSGANKLSFAHSSGQVTGFSGVFTLDTSASEFTRFYISSFNPESKHTGGIILRCFTTGQTCTIDIKFPQITATHYPVPYTPPGTTVPASHATVTNGCWFTLADGSPVRKALTGQPLTLATRVRMGVESADLPNSSVLNALTPDDVAGRFLTIQKSAGGVLTANLSDGTNTATVPLAAWSRGDVLQFFPQVQTGGTQMRLGYKTSAAESITWGDLATYYGSFGPDTTLDKLMLGFGNPYPMWFNKIAVWNKQMDDAAILEALK